MYVGRPLHTSPTRIVKFHRNKMKTEKDVCYVNKMNFVVGKVECEIPLNVSISCVQNSRVIRHENKEAAKPICETRRNTHISFIGHQIVLSIRHARPHVIRLSVNLKSSIFRIVFFSCGHGKSHDPDLSVRNVIGCHNVTLHMELDFNKTLICFYFAAGYKRYPMYVSPLSERIRKRKAFADSELDSRAGLMAIPQTSLSPPTLSVHPNAAQFVSHTPSMFSMQTYAQENRYRFQKFNQRNEDCDANRFVPRIAHHLPTSTNTDETNLIESNSMASPTSVNTFGGIKPKLSFSIESIIGFK